MVKRPLADATFALIAALTGLRIHRKLYKRLMFGAYIQQYERHAI